MATVQDIISRAFRKIGVLAKDEVLDGGDYAEGLDALTMMIQGWELQGVDFEFTEPASGSEFALDSKYHEGVVYLLASRLSPDYMVPPSFDADQWFRRIQADKAVIPTVTMPSALRNMPSQRQYGLADD